MIDKANSGITLTIIVCTHDRYDVLLDAIASIEHQTLAQSAYELIVVDNSSDLEAQTQFTNDLTIACASSYIIESRPGLSRARNIGLEYAKGRLVAFIDDDAIADPGWGQAIVNRFAQDPTIGILGGPVVPIWPVARPSWLHPWQEGFLTIVDFGATARTLKPNEWLAGTNVAYPKEAVAKVGGFSESLGRSGRYLLSNEELQVAEKIKANGLTCFYDPSIVVRHRINPERLSQKWMRQRVAWQALSDIMSEAASPAGSSLKNINAILDFFDASAPRDRGAHGLFVDLDDAKLFQRQTTAIYSLLYLMLSDASDWRPALGINTSNGQ